MRSKRGAWKGKVLGVAKGLPCASAGAVMLAVPASRSYAKRKRVAIKSILERESPIMGMAAGVSLCGA